MLAGNRKKWQLMKSLSYSDYHRYARYISIQPQYGLINREMDREMFSLCKEENVAIIPWAPIGGGFLSGKYKKNTIPKEGRLSGDKGESSWSNRNKEIFFLYWTWLSKSQMTWIKHLHRLL